MASVAGTRHGGPLEILVAAPRGAPGLDAVRREFEGVRVLDVPAPATVPHLYAAGLRSAAGDCVALTNDAFIPSDGWVDAVRAVHARLTGPAVVGGAITIARDATPVDRAVFYAEYGGFAPPFQAGSAAAAPGPNVSYNRAALVRLGPLLADPAWEYFWHEALARTGVQILREPSMIVRYVRRWTVAACLRERYHYSRAFAAERTGSWSGGRRFGRGALSLCLPPLLLARIVRRHAHERWRLLEALPALALITLPWALGEAVGCWTGGGDSRTRVGLA